MQDHETLFNSFRFSSYFLFTLNSNGRPYNGGRMFVIISCATLLLLTPFCICSTGEMERHFSLANVIKIKTYSMIVNSSSWWTLNLYIVARRFSL